MGKGRKRQIERIQEQKKDETEFNLPAKHMKTSHVRAQERRLIVILDGAHLETVKVGNAFELLNCDDHMNMLRKNGRDPGSCRPDITHQSLLMLFDSPLNRAGLLQVYIHTAKNVLIEINPQTRIPRTLKRFGGLMGKLDGAYLLFKATFDTVFSTVQLLHKMSVRATDTSVKLMKVIKNPVTDYLPVGCKKFGMSFGGKLMTPKELVPVEATEPIALVIGAFAHGSVNPDYTEGMFSISNYPLSAALACSKLCSAFEEAWGIV